MPFYGPFVIFNDLQFWFFFSSFFTHWFESEINFNFRICGLTHTHNFVGKKKIENLIHCELWMFFISKTVHVLHTNMGIKGLSFSKLGVIETRFCSDANLYVEGLTNIFYVLWGCVKVLAGGKWIFFFFFFFFLQWHGKGGGQIPLWVSFPLLLSVEFGDLRRGIFSLLW